MPTIYVLLVNEGTDVWRPVEAADLGGDRFRISPETEVPADEEWAFGPGDIVRVRWRRFSDGERYEAIAAASPAV